jgi:hypothetical protein
MKERELKRRCSGFALTIQSSLFLHVLLKLNNNDS